jgi:hypothetical protein
LTEQVARFEDSKPPWWTDPTANVISLVDAAMKRQDDLREQDSEHVRELIEVRAQYDEKLRAAEADRINAIQTRSDLTVQRAAEVQAAQAQTLATQVATTADAFRASLAAALAPLQASIEDLRRAQYEAQGQKAQVVETRDVRNDQRLNVNVMLAVLTVIITAGILYATFHK